MPLNTFTIAGTYHDSVLACEFINEKRVGLPSVVRATLLTAAVEDVEIVIPARTLAMSSDGGFSDTGLSNKKYRVGRSRLIL